MAQERQDFRLEVPDQVYKRLVRMLINSVMQEKKAVMYNKAGKQKLQDKK